MGFFDLFGDDKTPVHLGHEYVDKVTGERFTVNDVGTRVEIERNDAKHQSVVMVPKELLLNAIENGIVEHYEGCCTELNDVRQ